MRARWLKPEFFSDSKMAHVGVLPAFIYEALWCVSDDYGVARCDPDFLKGTLFYKWKQLREEDIMFALCELHRAGRIEIYVVGDECWCFMPTFDEHQDVHKPSKHHNPTLEQGQGSPGWLREFLSAPGFTGSPPGTTGTPHILDSYTPRHLDTEIAREDQVLSTSPSRSGDVNSSVRSALLVEECGAFATTTATAVLDRDETSPVVSNVPQNREGNDILYGALPSRHNNDNNLAQTEEKTSPQDPPPAIHTPGAVHEPDHKCGISACDETTSPSPKQADSRSVPPPRKVRRRRAAEDHSDSLSTSAAGLAPPKQIPANWPAIAAEMFAEVAWYEPGRWGKALKPLVDRQGISRVLWAVANYTAAALVVPDTRPYTPERVAREWIDCRPANWADVGLGDPGTPIADIPLPRAFVVGVLDRRPELHHAILRLAEVQRSACLARVLPTAPAINGVVS